MGNNNQQQNGKKKKPPAYGNWLETLKEAGADVAGQVAPMTDNMFEQILGFTPGPGSKGELKAGQSMEIGSQIKENKQETPGISKQAFFEKQQGQENLKNTNKDSRETQLRIKQLMVELQKLVVTTSNLGQEVKVASMQNIAEPNEYHIGVLEHLIKMVKDFRVQAESAVTWLQSSNSRAQKKNFWARYKNKKTGGSKFLLSGEHYMTRSAG